MFSFIIIILTEKTGGNVNTNNMFNSDSNFMTSNNQQHLRAGHNQGGFDDFNQRGYVEQDEFNQRNFDGYSSGINPMGHGGYSQPLNCDQGGYAGYSQPLNCDQGGYAGYSQPLNCDQGGYAGYSQPLNCDQGGFGDYNQSVVNCDEGEFNQEYSRGFQQPPEFYKHQNHHSNY